MLKNLIITVCSLLALNSLSVKATTVVETVTTDNGNEITRQVQYFDDTSTPPTHVYMAPPSIQTMDAREVIDRQDMIVQRDRLRLRQDEESLKDAYDHLNYEKTNPAYVGIELYRHNIKESYRMVNYYERIVDNDKRKLNYDMQRRDSFIQQYRTGY